MVVAVEKNILKLRENTNIKRTINIDHKDLITEVVYIRPV